MKKKTWDGYVICEKCLYAKNHLLKNDKRASLAKDVERGHHVRLDYLKPEQLREKIKHMKMKHKCLKRKYKNLEKKMNSADSDKASGTEEA